MEPPRRRKFNQKRVPSTPKKKSFLTAVQSAFTPPRASSSGSLLKHPWPFSPRSKGKSPAVPAADGTTSRPPTSICADTGDINPFWQPTAESTADVEPEASQPPCDILSSEALPPVPDVELDEAWTSDEYNTDDTDDDDEVKVVVEAQASKKPRAATNNTIVSPLSHVDSLLTS